MTRRCKRTAEMHLAAKYQLTELCNYEEIHLHPGWRRLLAACEQKTETVAPAASASPEATTGTTTTIRANT